MADRDPSERAAAKPAAWTRPLALACAALAGAAVAGLVLGLVGALRWAKDPGAGQVGGGSAPRPAHAGAGGAGEATPARATGGSPFAAAGSASTRARRPASGAPREDGAAGAASAPASSSEASAELAGLREALAAPSLSPELARRLDALIAAHPEDGRLYFLRGRRALRAGRVPEALADFLRAERAARPFVEPVLYRARGLLRFRLRNWTAAADDLERAAAAFPDDAEVAFCWGVVLRSLRRYPEALAALERAERLEPRRWQAAFNLGGTLDNLGRYSEAVAPFERAHRAARGRSLWPLLRKTDCQLQLGRMAEAEADLERLEREVPEARTARGVSMIVAQRSRACALAGRLDEARALALQALQLEENDRSVCAWAFVLEREGRIVEALAVCERALAQGIDTSLLRATLRRLRD
ncbi:MAG: tetratricopeptide repeat protein [Planctomycetota bacterium]|nr:MAG: tetratricopeptide repeat protein [Planctomycetota bacterium]